MIRGAPILLAAACFGAGPTADGIGPIPAGMYVRVEDAFSQEFLTIKADGSYSLVSMADSGAYRIAGTAQRRGGSLFLSEPGPRLVTELRIVAWGDEVFLVEPSDLDWFCSFTKVAAGQVKKGAIPPRCIFLQSGKRLQKYPAASPAQCRDREASS